MSHAGKHLCYTNALLLRPKHSLFGILQEPRYLNHSSTLKKVLQALQTTGKYDLLSTAALN